MRTIRGKMLLSFILALVVTVGITVALFVRLIDDILVNQVKAQLHGQAEKAEKILQDSDISRLNNTEFKYVVKGMMLNADYLILDASNKIIDTNDDKGVGTTFRYALSGRQGIAVLHGKKILYTKERLSGRPYSIFIYAPLSSLRALYGSLMRTTLLAIGFSFFMILAIGLLTVSRVVRPLNRLKEAVGRYEPYRSQDAVFPVGDTTEIGELITTFQSMSERIQQHQRNQVEFLQNVSHELKTPLMSIHGFVYAIQDQVVPQETGLDVILTQSMRLIDMVDKLLQLSRLEAVDEHWPTSEIDLHTMAEEAALLLMPAANARGVVLKVEGESLLTVAAGEQLFQVLVNLLQNAVRHTSSQIRVQIEADYPGADWAIHIDDDGNGLSEAEKEAVFQRFYTGPNGVTGLGLAICRQIAANMDAELTYTSSPLGGARFSFIKPAGRLSGPSG
ncbi:HAMP domain-containing sensor histidine kinase [Paenibacillus graminis]|uniref:sensor histidine kinase n=1 Tax=Paenibacillus graminis TaxID=189425 RepID=UPI002DBB82AE|nr:HAMP domain-containing sensor histidine kinase [Paenibacillus graminis]MEC0168499.1 HAMP domain-containing sensor histidine kinase [Paenibacillus graminis]